MKNTITWFDIPTLDFSKALKFYGEVLGAPLRIDDYLGQTLAYFPMGPKGDMGKTWCRPASTTNPPGWARAFF